MNRRALIKSLATFLAGLFLPPIRFVQAKVLRPAWAGGRKYWEHLAEPEAVKNAAELSPDPGVVAHTVCRMAGPAKAPRVTLMDFEAHRDAPAEGGKDSETPSELTPGPSWEKWEGWGESPYREIYARIKKGE